MNTLRREGDRNGLDERCDDAVCGGLAIGKGSVEDRYPQLSCFVGPDHAHSSEAACDVGALVPDRVQLFGWKRFERVFRWWRGAGVGHTLGKGCQSAAAWKWALAV